MLVLSAASCSTLSLFWLLEERTGAWFDQYLEIMLGKSFIIAFHKTLAAST